MQCRDEYMVIVNNMLVRTSDSQTILRVLDTVAGEAIGLDEPDDYVVVIDIDPVKRCMPEFLRRVDVLDHLAHRRWRVTKDTATSIDLEILTGAERRNLERRWKILQRALQAGAKLYSPRQRAEIARDLKQSNLVTRPALYAILRLYWKGGGGKESLLPRFHSCGAPGKSRVPESESRKAGRKRTTQPGVGVAMTQEHRRKVTLALQSTPVGKDGRGLRGAYNHLLIRHYPSCVRISPDKPLATPNILLPDSVPTYEQFLYFWKTEISLEVRLRRRHRARGFERLTKMLTTGTLRDVRGPGARYYIDATIVDVYVVSRYNRTRIIGRPTLYLVVDDFSRLIVGLYIGLEPPCWAGAMLALWHCNVDKVAWCAKYGIQITEEQWPTAYMPTHLMADRGEFSSKQAELLVAGFDMDVENAPPYKGEAKGVVERAFRTKQARFGPYVPGYVDKEFLGRDAPPAALSAAVDLDQLTRIFASGCVIHNHHVIREYQGSPELIVDNVEYTPASLWHWGVRNLRYHGRQFSEDRLARHLWPEAKLKFTRRGLQFYRGLWYMGTALQEQPWFLNAKMKEERFNARVHPHELSQIYLLPNEPRTPMLPIPITKRSDRFAERTLSELLALESQKRRQNAAASWSNLPLEAQMTRIIEQTVKEGKQMSKATRDSSLSNRARLAEMRMNRAEELAHMSIEALDAAFNSPSPGTIIDAEPDGDDSHSVESRHLVDQLLLEQQPPVKHHDDY